MDVLFAVRKYRPVQARVFEKLVCSIWAHRFSALSSKSPLRRLCHRNVLSDLVENTTVN